MVYMANAAGAKFADPQRPAATATTAEAPAAAVVPVAAAATTSAAPAAAPAAVAAPAPATTQVAAAGGGEALYTQVCVACHAAGVAGAPKFGDKAAWAPRIALGVPQLVQSVLKGKGAMPPKGGSAASEAEIRATVEYMVSAAK
ncbi:MAG: hypothetical protein NVS3B2_18860 [Ramlibacter sp.]